MTHLKHRSDAELAAIKEQARIDREDREARDAAYHSMVMQEYPHVAEVTHSQDIIDDWDRHSEVIDQESEWIAQHAADAYIYYNFQDRFRTAEVAQAYQQAFAKYTEDD